MGGKKHLDGSGMKRNVCKRIVHNPEPVTLCYRFHTAEYLAPAELKLPAKVCGDDALVINPAFRIVWGPWLIKRMTMAEVEGFHTSLLAGNGVHIKLPAVRTVDAERVPAPPGDGKSVAGDDE